MNKSRIVGTPNKKYFNKQSLKYKNLKNGQQTHFINTIAAFLSGTRNPDYQSKGQPPTAPVGYTDYHNPTKPIKRTPAAAALQPLIPPTTPAAVNT